MKYWQKFAVLVWSPFAWSDLVGYLTRASAQYDRVKGSWEIENTEQLFWLTKSSFIWSPSLYQDSTIKQFVTPLVKTGMSTGSFMSCGNSPLTAFLMLWAKTKPQYWHREQASLVQMSQIKVERESRNTGTACLGDQESDTKSCPKGMSHHMLGPWEEFLLSKSWQDVPVE